MLKYIALLSAIFMYTYTQAAQEAKTQHAAAQEQNKQFDAKQALEYTKIIQDALKLQEIIHQKTEQRDAMQRALEQAPTDDENFNHHPVIILQMTNEIRTKNHGLRQLLEKIYC